MASLDYEKENGQYRLSSSRGSVLLPKECSEIINEHVKRKNTLTITDILCQEYDSRISVESDRFLLEEFIKLIDQKHEPETGYIGSVCGRHIFLKTG